jgi:hypothetical protein
MNTDTGIITNTNKNAKTQLGTGGSHYNPRYSGGRDQEDQGSKPVLSKEFLKLSQKKFITKMGWCSHSSRKSTAQQVW